MRKVGLDVFYIFQAGREPHQTFPNACFDALFRRESAVGGGRRMRNGAFDIAEIGGDGDHARRIDHAPSLSAPSLYIEGKNAAEGGLLLCGKGVVRVGGKPRIIYARDARLVFEPTGDFQRRCAVGLHPQGQGLQPLEEDPGIEGTHGCPRCP